MIIILLKYLYKRFDTFVCSVYYFIRNDYVYPILWKGGRLLRTESGRQNIHIFYILICGLIIWMAFFPESARYILLGELWKNSSFAMFKTILLGILLETLPFLLLGVIVSSVMQQFVSESFIRKCIPRNPLFGIPFACVLGFIFPVCECGLIPIVRRLIAKGMPLYIRIVFIIVGPIVNPVVLAATYTAFRTRPDLIYSRMGLALAVGLLIGLIIFAFVKGNPLRQKGLDNNDQQHNHNKHADHPSKPNKLLSMIEHAGNEFFDMGKYVMLGSILTAAIQTFLPRTNLAEIGQAEFSSVFFMMGFAYILSICSTSDAFVASSFASIFSSSSLLAFLVFGPMLDFKSTLMLLSVFKKRFVLLLSLLIFIAVFVGVIILGHFYFRY